MRPGPKQEWTVRSIRQDRFAARALGRVGFESNTCAALKVRPREVTVEDFGSLQPRFAEDGARTGAFFQAGIRQMRLAQIGAT
jgi:hypothetical protein